MSIGTNIRQRRRAKDISQEILADKVGVSRASIVQFEKDYKAPTLPVAKAIAEALDCTLDELANS